MTHGRKIVRYEELALWREQLDATRRPLVVTNGCFDLLHAGHVRTLAKARELGAMLLVGVTGDAGVRALKGAGRPVFGEGERAEVIAALQAVDAVCIFPGPDAVEFLGRARPDLYVKGGDYALETINQDERSLLEAIRCQIRFLPKFAGLSSTEFLRRIEGPVEGPAPCPRGTLASAGPLRFKDQFPA